MESTQSTQVRCSNCAAARRICKHHAKSFRCQRCIGYDLHNCDIRDQVASLPEEASFIAGQPSPTSLKEEQPSQSQASKPSELKWELLVKGDYVLIIGIDVGTKNSSACWQVVPKDQKLTPNFKPQVRNVTSAGEWRIPTQAVIIPEGDQSRLVFSGEEIEDHMGEDLEPHDVFTLLKLMLVRTSTDDNNSQKEMIDALQRTNNSIFERFLQAQPLPANIDTVLDIFREFLRYLRNIIYDNIASAVPLTGPELKDVWEKHTRVVVAVPAIWTATMNNHFRRLLLDAKFPCAHIRSEPKLAAAVIVQEQQQENGLLSTAVERAQALAHMQKTARIVVDIGGGTTDLSCIQVIQTWPVLKFRTLMVGIGSMSGSELLNSFFKDKLSEILSDDLPHIAATVGMTADEVLKSFVQGFEKAKRTFNGKADMVKIAFEPVRPMAQNLPRIPELNLGVKFIRISAADISDVFENYQAEIKPLISSQLTKAEEGNFAGIERFAIMLVGGGSLIPYIRDALRNEYTREGIDQGIEVTQHDDNNCSLVAKGAVLAAIDDGLGTREFARTTYGTVLSIEYNPDIRYHLADKHLRVRAPSYVNWVWELPNRFHALIKHGTNLVNPSKVPMINETIDFRAVDVSWPLELEHKIYQVDDPAWGLKDQFWSIREAPTTVVHTATLTIKIPKDECTFRSRYRNGVRYYRINFRVRPDWDGLCEKWLFFVHPTGKKIITEEDEKKSHKAEYVLENVMAVQTMEVDEDGEATKMEDLEQE